MKQLIIYYLAICLPLAGIVYCIGNSKLFVVLLLIYRPVVDALRLIDKGVLEKKKWWTMLSPFAQTKWFCELYWK